MKCQLKFTDTAKADLRSIAFYIFEQSKEKSIATRFVNELRDKCKILETAPECGAVPKDRVLASSGYRFIVHGNYLIFYYYEKKDNTVYITTIFNAKRDYIRVMKKFI